jgi:hypothetical protein
MGEKKQASSTKPQLIFLPSVTCHIFGFSTSGPSHREQELLAFVSSTSASFFRILSSPIPETDKPIHHRSTRRLPKPSLHGITVQPCQRLSIVILSYRLRPTNARIISPPLVGILSHAWRHPRRILSAKVGISYSQRTKPPTCRLGPRHNIRPGKRHEALHPPLRSRPATGSPVPTSNQSTKPICIPPAPPSETFRYLSSPPCCHPPT